MTAPRGERPAMTASSGAGMSAGQHASEEVFDPGTDWVARHVRTYVESAGAQGARYYGNDTLLLTTRGRRSGTLRRTALIYGRDGDRYVLAASNGGAASVPLWYLNLVADPHVTVQVGADVFTAVARPATPDERPALWTLMTSLFAPYAGYQQKTDRLIPVVVVERLTTGPGGGGDQPVST